MEMAQVLAPAVSAPVAPRPTPSPEGGADFRAQLQLSLQAARQEQAASSEAAPVPPEEPETPVQLGTDMTSAEEGADKGAELPVSPDPEAQAVLPEQAPLPESAPPPVPAAPVLIWEDFYRLQQQAPPTPAAPEPVTSSAPQPVLAASAVVSAEPAAVPTPKVSVPTEPEAVMPTASAPVPAGASPSSVATTPSADGPHDHPVVAQALPTVPQAGGQTAAADPALPAPEPDAKAVPTAAPTPAAPAAAAPASPAQTGLPAAVPPPAAGLNLEPLLRPGHTLLPQNAQAAAEPVLTPSAPVSSALNPAPEILAEASSPDGLAAVAPGSTPAASAPPVQAAVPRSAHAELVQRFELVQQLSRHVDLVRLQQGVQRAELQLEPAHLGKIQLQLQQSAQQVSLQILTELPLAKELIEASIAQLRQNLAQQGLHLQQVQVQVQPDLGSQAGFQQSPGEQSSSQSPASQARAADAFDLFAPAEAPVAETPTSPLEAARQAVNTLV